MKKTNKDDRTVDTLKDKDLNIKGLREILGQLVKSLTISEF